MQDIAISGKQDNRKTASVNRAALGRDIAVLFCPAANGKVFGVTIDRADLERTLARGFWKVHNFHSSEKSPKKFQLYCFRNKRTGGVELLHRFLLNAPAGKMVDHRFRRSLDNRQSASIRLASREDNARNSRKGRPNKTGYRGVLLIKGRFRATICVNNKRIVLGHFPSAIEAAEAYDKAAIEHHGEFAFLNFPASLIPNQQAGQQ